MRTMIVIGGILLMLTNGWAADIYVAAAGDDANPGTAEAPFATLQKAVDASRALGVDEPRRIIVRAGDYYDVAIDLDARDSGLTIEGAPNEPVTLYGGRLVTGWVQDEGELWAAPIPGAKDHSWDFRMLSINDRFCPRARLPEDGFFEHLTEFTVPWMGTTGGGWQRKPTTEELTTMKYKPEDIGPWLDTNNAELTVYHSWDESVVGVSANDTETNTLTLSTPCGHPPGGFGIKKYELWNVREGMTHRDQWYLDRTRERLVYWPLPAEDVRAERVIAPTTEFIIRIRGTQENPARNITVRGLKLSVTTTPLKAGGFGASRFEGAVSASMTEDCRFEGLEVFNVGGQGIKTWKCPGLYIGRCHVRQTGACGIKVSDGDCVVTDNHIHDVGLTYPSAIALWGGGTGGKGSLFAHNEIHDTPYTAIACGGDDHRIENNHMYRCMQKMRDGAAIYITFCKRIVLRGNFAHDIVYTGHNIANAYYIDEQGEDCLVEGNLSINAGSPFLGHWSKNNTLRNNVFIHNGDMVLRFPRSEGYTFERNVLLADGKIVFEHRQAVTKLPSNVLFSKSGKYVAQVLDQYRKTQTKDLDASEGTVFADPLINQFQSGTVSYDAGSPAIGLAIEPIDVSKAGPRPVGE